MTKVLPFLLALLISVSLNGQTDGDGRSAFLRRSNTEAREYHGQKKDERAAFLRRSWTVTPECAPVEDPLRRESVKKRSDVSIASRNESSVKDESTSSSSLALSYYGRTYSLDRTLMEGPVLPSVAEDDVAGAWENLTRDGASLLNECLAIRKREALGDWAYLQLVDSLSAVIYPFPGNERELLFGFLLGSSGFTVRFGRSGEELSCLWGTEQVIYSKPYFFKDGIYYYRHRSGEGPLSLSEAVPEGKRALDLRLSAAPKIQYGPVQERHIEVGGTGFDFRITQGLLDFYDTYPHTEMYIKACAPVSSQVREYVYPILREAVAGKGEMDAVRTILRFAQGLMEYRTDDDRWGREKWNFPEESLFYRCGDCDDHAILFTRLVRDLLGLEVLLVGCEVDGAPHATAAVRLSESPERGSWIQYGGERYYCCEPSSRSADVGDRCWNDFVVTRLDRVE